MLGCDAFLKTQRDLCDCLDLEEDKSVAVRAYLEHVYSKWLKKTDKDAKAIDVIMDKWRDKNPAELVFALAKKYAKKLIKRTRKNSNRMNDFMKNLRPEDDQGRRGAAGVVDDDDIEEIELKTEM